eukprot:gene6423-9316_t
MATSVAALVQEKDTANSLVRSKKFADAAVIYDRILVDLT